MNRGVRHTKGGAGVSLAMNVTPIGDTQVKDVPHHSQTERSSHRMVIWLGTPAGVGYIFGGFTSAYRLRIILHVPVKLGTSVYAGVVSKPTYLRDEDKMFSL